MERRGSVKPEQVSKTMAERLFQRTVENPVSVSDACGKGQLLNTSQLHRTQVERRHLHSVIASSLQNYNSFHVTLFIYT